MAAMMPLMARRIFSSSRCSVRLGAALMVAAVRLLVMDAHRVHDGIWRHQLFGQVGEDEHSALDDWPEVARSDRVDWGGWSVRLDEVVSGHGRPVDRLADSPIGRSG